MASRHELGVALHRAGDLAVLLVPTALLSCGWPLSRALYVSQVIGTEHEASAAVREGRAYVNGSRVAPPIFSCEGDAVLTGDDFGPCGAARVRVSGLGTELLVVFDPRRDAAPEGAEDEEPEEKEGDDGEWSAIPDFCREVLDQLDALGSRLDAYQEGYEALRRAVDELRGRAFPWPPASGDAFFVPARTLAQPAGGYVNPARFAGPVTRADRAEDDPESLPPRVVRVAPVDPEGVIDLNALLQHVGLADDAEHAARLIAGGQLRVNGVVPRATSVIGPWNYPDGALVITVPFRRDVVLVVDRDGGQSEKENSDDD